MQLPDLNVTNPDNPIETDAVFDVPLRDKEGNYIYNEEGKAEARRYAVVSNRPMSKDQRQGLLQEVAGYARSLVTNDLNSVVYDAMKNVSTSSETQPGIVELATSAETGEGKDDERAISPKSLTQAFKDENDNALKNTLNEYIGKTYVTKENVENTYVTMDFADNTYATRIDLYSKLKQTGKATELSGSLETRIKDLENIVQSLLSSGTRSETVSMPTIDTQPIIIGQPCTFSFSAKSLLNSAIKNFRVTLTGQPMRTIEATQNGTIGTASTTYTIMSDDIISVGDVVTLSVIATDYLGNASNVASQNMTVYAIAPENVSERSLTQRKDVDTTDNVSNVMFSTDNVVLDQNDVQGDGFLISNTFELLPDNYSTIGLDTNTIYLEDAE